MPTEKSIEAAIGKHAKKLGCLYIKMDPTHARGIPDRLVVGPGGRVLWMEVKNEKGRLSAGQVGWGNLLTGIGHDHVVVWSSEDGINAINEWRYPK